jgi:hypothetical protein
MPVVVHAPLQFVVPGTQQFNNPDDSPFLPHSTPGQPVASVIAVIVPPEKVFAFTSVVPEEVVMINGDEPFKLYTLPLCMALGGKSLP